MCWGAGGRGELGGFQHLYAMAVWQCHSVALSLWHPGDSKSLDVSCLEALFF